MQNQIIYYALLQVARKIESLDKNDAKFPIVATADTACCEHNSLNFMNAVE